LGNALAEGGKSYASDDDPELIREAVPFGLKTVEGLLEESPRHKGLLLAAASGFTQYGFAFIQQDADFVEAQDLARATALRDRARKHYRRALEYGLRGLEVDHPGFRTALRNDPAWGAAIALSKDDSELTADQNLAEALMRRAMALDEGYERGSVHDFFISYEGGRRSVGGSVGEARQHLERALALSGGHRAWPLVNFAETVAVGDQNRQEFDSMLRRALAIDPDAVPEVRVANLVAQRRARWLLGRADELFVE
jgi:predicted anti-sigma-YlaC factor YlaD